MAIPKGGYFTLEEGKYGPVFPKTPACYGFSIIAPIKAGREDVIRQHGKTIEAAIEADPYFLAPLKLHFLRWQLFDIEGKRIFSIRVSSTPTSINTQTMPSRYSRNPA